MKKLDIYERKTVFIGIGFCVFNIIIYIFRIIPHNSVTYWSLLFFIPFQMVIIYITLYFENYYSVHIADTLKSEIIEDRAYFTKLALIPLLTITLIVSLFITKIGTFYGIIVFEFGLLSMLYPMDDAIHQQK